MSVFSSTVREKERGKKCARDKNDGAVGRRRVG